MTEWSGTVWVDPLVLLSMLAIVGGCALKFRKTIKRYTREWNYFQEDWNGIPARPGVPPRKGVMERLADQDTQLSFIQHELSFNSGLSVKDAVHRIDRKLGSED